MYRGLVWDVTASKSRKRWAIAWYALALAFLIVGFGIPGITEHLPRWLITFFFKANPSTGRFGVYSIAWIIAAGCAMIGVLVISYPEAD